MVELGAKTKSKPKSKILSGPKKAAIFLLTMGEEFASEIFKTMTESEIKRVATAMAQIDNISPEDIDKVAEDFLDNFEGQARLVVEGESFLKSVIAKTLSTDEANKILMDLEDRKRDKPFIWSRDVNVNTLSAALAQEHPQTIAMVLAHLPPEVASEVMTGIPEEKIGDISMRVAQLGQVPEEIVRDVDDALRTELRTLGSSSGKVGGLQVLVDILNGVDKSTEDSIMEYIEDEHADMATEIREMMFVFEDLINIDDRGMREVLKKVEGQQLTLALKTASDDMKNKILGNLSQRASEMLLEDLDVMGPVKLSEVEDAQQEIVRAAKELEADGTIVLGGKGKDDILV